ILLGMGIAPGKIRVTADPAFAFQPAPPYRLSDSLDPDFTIRLPVLGVAPRFWNVGVHPEFLERELAAALDLFLEQTGGTAVLVPFKEISGERENDRATAERILGQMPLRDHAAILGGPVTPDLVYRALGDCDLVLAMRLHPLIFGATTGVPPVAVSYDPKV